MIVSIDSSSRITKCYSDKDGTIDAAKRAVCEDLGGSYNSEKEKCEKYSPTIAAGGTCDKSSEGKLNYNATKKILQICDGATLKDVGMLAANTTQPAPQPSQPRSCSFGGKIYSSGQMFTGGCGYDYEGEKQYQCIDGTLNLITEDCEFTNYR